MQTTKMPVQAGGVQLNVKALVIAIVAAVTVLYFLYSLTSSKGKQQNDFVRDLTSFHSWKTMDFVDIPKHIIDKASRLTIKERRLSFEFEGKTKELLVRELDSEQPAEKKVPILLLHGAAFTSKNWQDLGTLQILAAMGHRFVALDLPGWGESTSYGKVDNKAGFLEKFIKQERLDRPVIISPSMSGSFSIPYIMGNKPIECTDKVRGFVPVAPVGTDSYTHAQWHRCETPTMIVYGTKDTSLGHFSLGNLRNMPNNEIMKIDGAKHPAYLEQPKYWHKLLYNFLLAVERE